MDYISAEDCKHGYLYRIRSRNLSFGVCRKTSDKDALVGFIGIRTKFGDRFLFEEYHWDVSEHYGTVHPLEELGKCPIEDISEGHSEIITEEMAESVPHFSERDIGKSCFARNKPLFKWLDKKRKEHGSA